MAQINLLPWREELRKEQTNSFLVMLGLSILLTICIIAVIHFNIAGMISHQEKRNKILKDEISRLDIELIKIQDLESTKAQLLSRMEIIQSLQQKRPQIVHLFDEIVRTVPEGLHINELTQLGGTLTINGIAESNGRVSAYMRNIDNSDWLTKPRLNVIESIREDGRGSKFTLIAKQSSPKADDDKAEEL